MIYINTARKYRIFPSHQNQSNRSSYIVTGAGIIFFFAWILFFLLNEMVYPTFTFGLFILSLFYLIDDITSFHPILHVGINSIALTMLFVELGMFDQLGLHIIFPIYFICLYVLHMFHFMNRVNGMTGLYALSFFISMILISSSNMDFVIENPIYFIIIALGVFGIFNFRKKAAAFSGDVGVYSISYLLLFFLLQLVFGKQNFLQVNYKQVNVFGAEYHLKYVLFISVYAVDSIMTLLFTTFTRMNSFITHRGHFYEFLSRELNISHLLVAIIYATIQFLINVYVMHNQVTLMTAMYILGGLSAVYLFFKVRLSSSKAMD